MKTQGVYILLRLFPFSQNRQGILSTRLYFHEPKDKCPCLNCLLPKGFTVSISIDEKKLIQLNILYQPFSLSVHTLYKTQMLTNKAQWRITAQSVRE